jgi:hypothetical protein
VEGEIAEATEEHDGGAEEDEDGERVEAKQHLERRPHANTHYTNKSIG